MQRTLEPEEAGLLALGSVQALFASFIFILLLQLPQSPYSIALCITCALIPPAVALHLVLYFMPTAYSTATDVAALVCLYLTLLVFCWGQLEFLRVITPFMESVRIAAQVFGAAFCVLGPLYLVLGFGELLPSDWSTVIFGSKLVLGALGVLFNVAVQTFFLVFVVQKFYRASQSFMTAYVLNYCVAIVCLGIPLGISLMGKNGRTDLRRITLNLTALLYYYPAIVGTEMMRFGLQRQMHLAPLDDETSMVEWTETSDPSMQPDAILGWQDMLVQEQERRQHKEQQHQQQQQQQQKQQQRQHEQCGDSQHTAVADDDIRSAATSRASGSEPSYQLAGMSGHGPERGHRAPHASVVATAYNGGLYDTEHKDGKARQQGKQQQMQVTASAIEQRLLFKMPHLRWTTSDQSDSQSSDITGSTAAMSTESRVGV
ncbi:hypothetical protein BC831DRAFT_442502 [Entophlyctis helioformis]|nr:hypothetical protein BC831DRAFT_442502 [Entophlyctis helioformis]